MTAPLPTSSRYTPHPSTLTPHGGTKAMILAAGKGTRLLPLTKHLPKCLMTLAGRPLIDWQLSWLKKHGVTECVINLHYLADLVRDYVGDGRRYGLAVHYSFEPELLGTAGAVKKVAELFDEPFYVIYSDNFSRWDIRKLKTAYENVDCKGTIAVHWREDVTKSGMIELDENGRILQLLEKPSYEQVTSHYVSAGFFYMDKNVFRYIPENGYCDFGFNVFPAMLQAGELIYAVKMDEPIIGIDTREMYEEANALALEFEKTIQK